MWFLLSLANQFHFVFEFNSDLFFPLLICLFTDTDIGTYQLYEKGEPGMLHLVTFLKISFIYNPYFFMKLYLNLFVSFKIFKIVKTNNIRINSYTK